MKQRPYNFVPDAVISSREFRAITEEDAFKIGIDAIVKYYREKSKSTESTTRILKGSGVSDLLEAYGLKSKEESLKQKEDAQKVGGRVAFIGNLERLAKNPLIAEVKPDNGLTSYTIKLRQDMTTSDIKSLLMMYKLPEPKNEKAKFGSSSLNYKIEGVEFLVQVYTRGYMMQMEDEHRRREDELRKREREEMGVRRRERKPIEEHMKRLIGPA